MEKIILNVAGMSCGHCVKTIEGSVGILSGIKDVMVSLEEGTVQVEFNPEEVKIDTIKQTIDEEGYEVQ
ncbi:copper chaperone CopZ [Bacillus litorisediminis]|uniref:copper chaperone CopZ n=1 Tax=Bacillus litorisediminis TaxID=2922713 RepID=UPI001FADB6A4|nr:copper chaperone CopZ [Bacillus litorisediminis]